MKKIIFVAALVISSFFISCASSGSLIPGENQAIIQNIYVEYLNIADTYYSQQNYDKAISYYTKALENKNIYWNAYYKLAKCYVFKSNWTEAEIMYKKILERDSDNMSIKSALAYIYSMNNNLDEALKAYEELYNLQPTDMESLENYIAVLLLKENTELSESLITKLGEEFPDSTNTDKFVAQLKKLKGDEESSNSESAEENEVIDENTEAADSEKEDL